MKYIFHQKISLKLIIKKTFYDILRKHIAEVGVQSAVLTVVVFDHAADVMEGDLRRDVAAPVIEHPDLVVLN